MSLSLDHPSINILRGRPALAIFSVRNRDPRTSSELLLELHQWLLQRRSILILTYAILKLWGTLVAQDTHVLHLTFSNTSTATTLSFIHNAAMHLPRGHGRCICTQFGLQTVIRVPIVAHLEQLLWLAHIMSEIIEVRLVASVDNVLPLGWALRLRCLDLDDHLGSVYGIQCWSWL